MSSVLTNTLEQIQHTGGRQPISLQKWDQYFHPMQLLEALTNSTPSATEPAAMPAATVLVHAGKTHAQSGPTQRKSMAVDAPPAQDEGNDDAWKIVSHTADNGDFDIKLLVMQRGYWCAIASYSYKYGQARRCIYYANGDRQPCFLDLPPQVVLEMAREDFTRHWLDYFREYLYEPRERSRFPGRETA